MSNSEALQQTDPSQPPVGQAGITSSVSEVKEVAAIMAKSGFFEDAKTAAQAAVKIMAGRELGIPEMASMRGIYVANGNTELSGPLLAALIKRSEKYDYKAKEVTDERAKIRFFENGEEVGTASFSIEDAKRAGIYKEDSAWTKYPSDMVFWRALSRGKRRYCPEIGWGATYVWGEGDTKVEQIKQDTQTSTLPPQKDSSWYESKIEYLIQEIESDEVDPADIDPSSMPKSHPIDEWPDEYRNDIMRTLSSITSSQKPASDTSDTTPEEDAEQNDSVDGLPFEEDAKLTPNTRKALHAAGKDVYGDGWDEKRAELVEHFTDGRTDSLTKISDDTGQKILSGIREKQKDDTPEMVTNG